VAQVRWTPEASDSLKQIFDFIALDNEAAARQTVVGLYEKAMSLSEYPRKGRFHRRADEGEIRIALHSHYRIAYHLDGDGSITILGVFHGAMDIDRHL
jgi:plasmid stabilization system protein ParE